MEISMDTTTTASTTTTTAASTLKSKKFPTMFKKMMLSSQFNNFNEMHLTSNFVKNTLL